MSEEILGIFPSWIQKGYWKTWICKLVFTTNRLIVAEEKRFGGRNILHAPYYICSQVSAHDRLKMKEVSAESILKANTENFEILYSDIATVETKSFSGHGHRDILVFTAGNLDVPKYTFSIAIRPQYVSDFENFLSTVLHDKI